MIAIKANELRDNFKGICDLVVKGETVIVSRPHNQNVVVLSEQEFNLREKALRNAEYLAKIDKSVYEIKQEKTMSFAIEDLEAMESMTTEEAKLYVDKVRASHGADL